MDYNLFYYNRFFKSSQSDWVSVQIWTFSDKKKTLIKQIFVHYYVKYFVFTSNFSFCLALSILVQVATVP